jgi:cholinesterase
MPSSSEQESIFQSVLETAGVSTLQEARGLSTEALQLVNHKMVGEGPYGNFVFSKFFSSIHIVRTDCIILVSFNDASNDTINLLMNTYYPAPADGQNDVLGQITRGRDLVTEALFTCNANYVMRAFGANSYGYVFSAPPSIHAQDLTYTFFNGPDAGPVENATLALIMEDYFTNFAITGNPNGPGLPYFPDYSGGMTQKFNLTFINQIPDYLQNERCLWWQKALYYYRNYEQGVG